MAFSMKMRRPKVIPLIALFIFGLTMACLVQEDQWVPFRQTVLIDEKKSVCTAWAVTEEGVILDCTLVLRAKDDSGAEFSLKAYADADFASGLLATSEMTPTQARFVIPEGQQEATLQVRFLAPAKQTWRERAGSALPRIIAYDVTSRHNARCRPGRDTVRTWHYDYYCLNRVGDEWHFHFADNSEGLPDVRGYREKDGRLYLIATDEYAVVDIAAHTLERHERLEAFPREQQEVFQGEGFTYSWRGPV